MRYFFLFLFFTQLIADDDAVLRKMIGSMLIVGFEGDRVDKESKIIHDINDLHLGGVILFDRAYRDKNKRKNIRSPKQLQSLTSALRNLSDHPVFIAVDEEGGKVERLKSAYGFGATPSAQAVSRMSRGAAQETYRALAKELRKNGIDIDFAPVVDMAVEPKNRVIVGLRRSYGDADAVITYASIFMDALISEGVIPVLKHFPGHGSSLGDSHKGFVDITHTWSEAELAPYKALIKRAPMIMSAHVFNAKLDDRYPATLSYAINTQLLREKLGFSGVLVSDDMQMKAISARYGLKEAVRLAINSGVDMLLFANQLEDSDPRRIVKTVYDLVRSGAISRERIAQAYARIERLHIKSKPIDFGKERVALTKEYIQKHYGLHVKDIAIRPHIIVLHWTALDSLEASFLRLKEERLLSDRADIAAASALNVSAHYLIDRDGTIYALMNDNVMARHVIGLNYYAIGVENVGGKDNRIEDLTPAQVAANIFLVRYLKRKYPSIDYLIGHYEYTKMQDTPYWLERDDSYRTHKVDPGTAFMYAVRAGVATLGLRAP